MSAIFTEGAAALQPKDDLMNTIKLAVLATAALLAAAACTPQTKQVVIPPEVASSDEALFREGERLMKRDPERALLYFRQIQESFSRSFFAQRAMLAIGDTYFEQSDEANMILAAAQYRSFLNLYPTSPSAPLAQYRVGLCSYKNMLKPGRDQTKTEEALAEFKKTIQLFPLAEEAKLAREKLKECEDRLAEHLFGIGDYYFRSKSYKAAIVRLNEILLKYPLFPNMDKVYFGLGESFFFWGKHPESVPYYTKLVTDYGTSKYGLKAQKRLKEIEAAKAKAPAAPAPAPVKK
jgi:outer membrane protein assembly factor BamD